MKRFFQWITGISIYGLFNLLFDVVVYSFVIWQLGIVWGGLIMAIPSFLLDWYSVKFYDEFEKDFLAMEEIKSLRDYEGKNLIKRLTKLILRRTPLFVQFIFFSLKFNPFITTIMMRKSAFEAKGMSRRDCKIFVISFTIGQIYWIFLIAGGVQGIIFFFSK